jgi:DNA-binding transcriptional MerR regulator
MALLPVLISLSVDLNSLVSFKANKPIQVVDVVLDRIFDTLDQSILRRLRMIREFLETGRPISGIHSFNETVQRLTESVGQMVRADQSQQSAGERTGDALTQVSRYLATVEAFTECTSLISTLNREEFISDNVL